MDLSNARWRRSSHTGSNGGNCVELARLRGAVAVRDSKDPGGPVLLVAAAALRAAVAPFQERDAATA
ncbi:DUF397 domain-containing protein [Actinomadura litoris]|uniref:DUF397 domain-containing protein n=1 Tax=Actinomadura litoris TaxID=2678616 RepID=UPI001FA7DBB3|nr:DUF397 domain-containing protein [Actinomadura litoris]